VFNSLGCNREERTGYFILGSNLYNEKVGLINQAPTLEETLP